jgi:hypothetical protein
MRGRLPTKFWRTAMGCFLLAPPLLASELFFETDVRPILKAACFQCHGEEEEKEGKLDVRLVRLLVAGGKSGPVLKPGDPEGSLLWEKLVADEMPKGEKKLSAKQKEVIREWILQGARTARPEPENVADARFTLEELEHWAFQPVAKVSPPKEGNPIDAFVGARLAKEGLEFSEGANRETLIRRLSFDVTGLPPTLEEVEAFSKDSSAGAYARVVDRLLASPHYGVRWARHWLDAAGYAESDGNALSDPKRDHAWRYRDYVIKAFNENKPVNEFIVEQLAGDELIEGEVEVGNPRHLEVLTATGFLRMAPDGTQRSNTLTDRNTAVANAMQVVSTSLLGMTVGCAQCHDHKYDPIGIDDYYAFRAIFDPAFPLNNWKQPASRLVDMTAAKVIAERAIIEAEAKTKQDDLDSRRRVHGTSILEEKLAAVPEETRDAVRAAVLIAPGKRSEEEEVLLATYPMVKTVDFILGQLVEYDGKAHAEFEKEKKKVVEIRARMPSLRMVMMTTEPSGVLPVSKVFFRGNPESPGRVVEPAELMVLRRKRPEVRVPGKSEILKTSGRRLAYARQLTDGSHPLTARVFVNRVWMHHFGRGLVATPGDFGLAGERPSHPELLDWLAQDFPDHGWDLKRLHRMILLSQTYQQQSRRQAKHDQIDPENALLARVNLRRLEAEAIRDALLSVSGKLNPALGGPSSPVSANGEGKAVLGGDKGRRSVFVEVQRRLPLNMLETFDQPVMTPNCNHRRQTTVAMQALWFLNDAELVAYADSLAKSLREESEFVSVQLTNLSLRLFSTPPTAAELQACESHLAGQRALFAQQGEKSDVHHRALASLCQVLLASNRFIYVD